MKPADIKRQLREWHAQGLITMQNTDENTFLLHVNAKAVLHTVGFACINNLTYTCSELEQEIFTSTYPAVDVQAELAKAKAWLIANPVNRKTVSGMPRFLNAWMARAQNSAKGPPMAPRVAYGPPVGSIKSNASAAFQAANVDAEARRRWEEQERAALASNPILRKLHEQIAQTAQQVKP